MNHRLFLLFTCILLLIAPALKAQLCNGSLGDPAVNITFGSGNGSNTGYTPTNAYIYSNTSCPNDGYYTITTATSACFNNAWHTVNADHTGNGAFMLVNASYTPGDFLVTTVADLCPGTQYEFAAWLMNVLRNNGIKPNITFSIETPAGAVLQQFVTGDIPETPQPLWKQYGFFFTTPLNNPVVVLRMTNNAPGGIGNDIALDDITFRPCGPVVTAVNQGHADTVDICEGSTAVYNFSASVAAAYIAPVYRWQVSADSGKSWKDIAGANSLTYVRNATGAGAYSYRLTVTELTGVTIPSCRIASNNIIINVHAKPVVNAGADKLLVIPGSVQLDGTATGDNPVVYWSPPGDLSRADITSPVATPPADRLYTLYATSAFGCKNEDAVFVKVISGIYVPTAFTPNNDGVNDTWQILFLDLLKGAAVSVYNRYGQLVYSAEDAAVNWNGNWKNQPQPADTYIYYVRFKNGRKQLRGTFNLIR
jgi:gliding motility-associated-like protein